MKTRILPMLALLALAPCLNAADYTQSQLDAINNNITSGNPFRWDQLGAVVSVGANAIVDKNGNVLLNGYTGTITGTSSNLTTPVIIGGLTASGSGANDFSGSTGPFKTSAGAVTIGPAAITESGNVTLTNTSPVLTIGAVSETATGIIKIPGKTSGQLNITTADATAQTLTLNIAAQTVGAATFTIPNLAGSSDTAVGLATTQTLTNKTFTSPVIGTSVVDAYEAYTPSGAGTVTLTAAQSGQTFLLDAATGVVYTLPAPVVGLTYYFQVSVSVTSNSHEVKTSSSSIFIEGNIAQIGSTTTFGFNANGSTIQAYKANGSTTGGLIGTQLKFVCVSATEWKVSGINVGSGTAATPFTATP